MQVISCSHGAHLGPFIAKIIGKSNSFLLVDKFPDDELRIRFEVNIKNKNIFLVQSFYGDISDCIIEVLLAADTARELGAKNVSLVAPYFPYMRQDKRFNKGEAVSQHIIANLLGKYFDSVLVVDPHLHRTKRLDQAFKVRSINLTSNLLIANFIKQNIRNPVIIGPDGESKKWAKCVAENIALEYRILKKRRYSSFHVEVKLNKDINLKGKSAVIVDDIVSTGHTILETAKILRRLGAARIYCICVHGIFVDRALEKLRKAGIAVICTNTIPNKAAKIDVSKLLAEGVKSI